MEQTPLSARPSDPKELAVVEKFIALQQEELAVKKRETENNVAEIQSNEKIALASIEAQKESDLAHAKTFKTAYIAGQVKIILAIIAIATFAIVALLCDKSAVALEIAKAIGFGVMGYLAGKGKGTLDARQKQEHHKD